MVHFIFVSSLGSCGFCSDHGIGAPLNGYGDLSFTSLAVSLLSRLAHVQDLLLCAKHLFIAARTVWHGRQSSPPRIATGLQRTALNGFWRLVGARYAVAAARHPATGLR